MCGLQVQIGQSLCESHLVWHRGIAKLLLQVHSSSKTSKELTHYVTVLKMLQVMLHWKFFS